MTAPMPSCNASMTRPIFRRSRDVRSFGVTSYGGALPIIVLSPCLRTRATSRSAVSRIAPCPGERRRTQAVTPSPIFVADATLVLWRRRSALSCRAVAHYLQPNTFFAGCNCNVSQPNF